jgi:aromatic-amino-acid transaminase
VNNSPFSQIEQAPPDPIIGLTEAFNANTNPNKVNLGVGVYQDSTGKVPVLQVVRESEARWREKEETKSYLPIDGLPAYNKAVQKLLFGEDSAVIDEGRAVTVQALGGTGALKVGADFLKRFFPGSEIWISDPSWENHRMLFEAAGFKVNNYPYYDPETHGLNFHGMIETLKGLPKQSVVVLHGCCHNPTGVDLSREQWSIVVELFRTAGLIPFIDFAYQGFGEGLDQDAFAIRAFADAGIPCLIANSFSKSFALYRERVGALTVLTSGAEESKRVLSQVKRVIRTNYSSPASHGAQVVAAVLGDRELTARWETELTEMRERIQRMRDLFVAALREKGVEQDFQFIRNQHGMFSYSGLSPAAVNRLRDEFGLYIVGSGRICLAALNEKNIGYVCEAIAEVV